MGDASTKLVAAKRAAGDHAGERVRRRIIAEAAKFGATLGKPDAKGGLPPQLVLNALRRDRYRCKRCGSRDKVGPHHKGGVVESGWLSRKGHANELNNISTICERCHDRVHDQARAEGVDSSQVLPEGDVGDSRRDRGQPRARPPR